MNKALYFVIGAGLGSAITYVITKNFYAKKADEEIKAIREYYGSREFTEEEVEQKEPISPKEDLSKLKPEMDTFIKKYSGITPVAKEEPRISPGNEPYEIDEETFDTALSEQGLEGSKYEDYDIFSTYHYYANGVLVDNNDNVVPFQTVAEFVGLGNLKQLSMKDENDDIIYIQNDVHKCVYEILREEEDYIDPHIEG